jgi:hypothetical protein
MNNATKLKVLYARKYQTREGEKTQWMEVGTAFQSERGTDILLYVVPPPNERGEIRIMTRPYDEQQRGYEGYGASRRAPGPTPAVSYARPPAAQAHTAPEPPGAEPQQRDDDLPF